MKTKIFGALALAATLPFAACSDSTGAEGPGTMSLLLTDEPGDFLQAIVEIERIEVVGDEVGPTVLMDEPFVTDLLTLSNDVATLTEDVTVPAGTYSQLRFIIPNACIEVEGELENTSTIYSSPGFADCEENAQPAFRTGSLQMPSYDQSGLKVNLPGGAITVSGDQYIILLDFDVSDSFGQQAGNSGQWVLRPSIKATEVAFSSSITLELTQALDGEDNPVLDAVGGSLADFEAVIDSEEEPVAFTDPDEDGVYTATFYFMMPGETYQVSVALQEGFDYGFTTEPESASVELGSGMRETVAFEVTSATAPSSN